MILNLKEKLRRIDRAHSCSSIRLPILCRSNKKIQELFMNDHLPLIILGTNYLRLMFDVQMRSCRSRWDMRFPFSITSSSKELSCPSPSATTMKLQRSTLRLTTRTSTPTSVVSSEMHLSSTCFILDRSVETLNSCCSVIKGKKMQAHAYWSWSRLSYRAIW